MKTEKAMKALSSLVGFLFEQTQEGFLSELELESLKEAVEIKVLRKQAFFDRLRSSAESQA